MLVRGHVITFLAGMVCFFLLNFVLGGGFFFWPTTILGIVVMAHYLYQKSITASDEWAKKRADELVDASYDLHHIENIRERRTALSKK